MPRPDIENSSYTLLLARCLLAFGNHTRRDQKLNAPGLDEALEKSNKNEK